MDMVRFIMDMSVTGDKVVGDKKAKNMDEFSAIEKYFAPLTMGQEAAADLQDDGAVLCVPEGHEFVVTSDTLNEGVHFMIGEAPDMIACKALRVNLSDLASMGATPLCYQLNIAFSSTPDDMWLEAFSRRLLEENKHFDIFCSGGDTTSIKSDNLSISITAIGVVPKGEAVRRGGAQDGDVLILTGMIGDAALGLKCLLEKGEGNVFSYNEAITRYRIPEPRVGIENILHEYVNAAIDVSDGVIADSIHIGRASGLGVQIDLDKFVYSNSVQNALEKRHFSVEEAVCGGDDYELILAVSKENQENLMLALKKNNLKPQVIGSLINNGLKNTILSNKPYRIDDLARGWRHF